MMQCVEDTRREFGAGLGALLLVLFAATGCRTVSPLAPANLSEPGWTVRQGQAVWQSGKERPEIAGELLLATKLNGDAFVQFSKTPFPLVIAQQATNHWQVQFPTENKRYSGFGTPPGRLIWFPLAQALAGKLPPDKWSWYQDANGWRLENRATKERLEGYFTANGIH
jgi:hypothetical protein